MQIDKKANRRISTVSRPSTSSLIDDKPRLITASNKNAFRLQITYPEGFTFHIHKAIFTIHPLLQEERQLTGRYIALGAAISIITLAIYHAWERKFAVLAGLFTPALIMFLYILWMLYSAHKDAKKMRRLAQIRAQAQLIQAIVRPTYLRHQDTISSNSTTSLSKLSTSSKSSTLQRNLGGGPNSLSSSKSSLISQKNYIVQNQKNTKNLKNNVYYPEVHKSTKAISATTSRGELDKIDKDSTQLHIENENLRKYRARLKKQLLLNEPIRVQLGNIEKGLARTYSIA